MIKTIFLSMCLAAFLLSLKASAQNASAQRSKMPALAQTPAPGRSFRDCSNGCPEMVVVPPGRFTMGAPAGEVAEEENLPAPYRGHSVDRKSTRLNSSHI